MHGPRMVGFEGKWWQCLASGGPWTGPSARPCTTAHSAAPHLEDLRQQQQRATRKVCRAWQGDLQQALGKRRCALGARVDAHSLQGGGSEQGAAGASQVGVCACVRMCVRALHKEQAAVRGPQGNLGSWRGYNQQQTLVACPEPTSGQMMGGVRSVTASARQFQAQLSVLAGEPGRGG